MECKAYRYCLVLDAEKNFSVLAFQPLTRSLSAENSIGSVKAVRCRSSYPDLSTEFIQIRLADLNSVISISTRQFVQRNNVLSHKLLQRFVDHVSLLVSVAYCRRTSTTEVALDSSAVDWTSSYMSSWYDRRMSASMRPGLALVD